jgi:hypothetical protein
VAGIYDARVEARTNAGIGEDSADTDATAAHLQRAAALRTMNVVGGLLGPRPHAHAIAAFFTSGTVRVREARWQRR